MRFSCLWIRPDDNKRIAKTYSKEELTAIVGDYVVSRAIERSETNTSVINQGRTWKIMIKYLKN